VKSPGSFRLVFIAAGIACFPLPVAAQAILGATDASNNAVVFNTPEVGLPNPAQVNIPGLPGNARPHGIGYYGSDNALISDFANNRVFVVRISTAALLDTISTAGTYGGTGTIAIAPSLTAALASGNSSDVSVISAPFGAGSTVTPVALPGTVAGYQTQAIAFNAAGRAFVYHNSGISVLDAPYNSVAFTIPVNNPTSGALAITPDGNNLLVTTFTGSVRIFSAPYSAASVGVPLVIPGGIFLDGIAVTPDGATALVVSGSTTSLFAVSAPFSGASTVESIPLPGGPYGSFEDIGISANGQLAILAGNDSGSFPNTPFVVAPFTAAGATVHDVTIPGGRGAGSVRFLPPGLAPGLTITKSAAATAVTGTDLTYTITYGNTGGLSAANVVIEDTVPAGTTFVSATGGGTHAAGVVTWNIGALNAGTVNQVVTMTVNVTATSGTVDNNAYTIEATNVPPIPGPPVSTTVIGVESFCSGDGSGTACPCANNGAAGNGCANSDHSGGANLASSGVPSLANDTFKLNVTDQHASSLTLFLQADAETPPATFGDGLRCLGGNTLPLFRVKNAHTSDASAPSATSIPPLPETVSNRSLVLGDPLSAGDVRIYQVAYRDRDAAFCPAETFNATNALRVVWAP